MPSTAANSAIDICSRALILIGADPITSFEDDTTEALVASNMYEDIARSQLSLMRWRFATEQAELAALVDEPTGRFDTAHQLPADVLMVNAITVSDQPINYTIYGDKVFSDVSPTQTVIADYIYRAGEEDWPSLSLSSISLLASLLLLLPVMVTWLLFLSRRQMSLWLRLAQRTVNNRLHAN